MDTGSAVRDGLDYICASPLRHIFNDPLLLSVAITVSIMLIVIYMFDKESTIVKTAVWVFMAVTGFVFIHNGILLKEQKKVVEGGAEKELIEGINLGVAPIADGASELTYLKG